MIEVLREVTDWQGQGNINNGIYHVNSKGWLVGYQPNSDSPYREFKNPMKLFSKARRKFEKIGERPEEGGVDTITVKGSKGETYVIQDGECSCPGFRFRGDCKHVKSLEVA